MTDDRENPRHGNTIINGVAYDPDGKPFMYPPIRLEKQEYAKVVSEINTYYHVKYKGKRIGRHYSGNDLYFFEIHGYDNYNFFDKMEG